MLPVYINYEDESSYKDIIEVLKYLLLEIDIDITIFDEKTNSVGGTSSEKGDVDNYIGDMNKSDLLDLLYHEILKKPTAKIMYKFCRSYGITTEKEYNEHRK